MSRMKAYIVGFDEAEQAELGDGVGWIPVERIEDVPSGEFLVVHDRARRDIPYRGDLQVILYMVEEVAVPDSQLSDYTAINRDLHSLAQLVACPLRFRLPRQVYYDLSEAWLAEHREHIASIPASKLPTDLEDAEHLALCPFCREELNLLTNVL